MARNGEASKAHLYDARDACIYCGMYRTNVDRMVHVCKPQRELEVDTAEAQAAGMGLEEYRRGKKPDGE